MWDRVVVVYKTDNKKGLRLTISEIEMLLFLYEQTFLTQKQLYRFYSIYVTTKKIRYDSFKNRIAKFVRLGLIDVHKYTINKKKEGVSMNILRLIEKGFYLLVKSGFLENKTFVPPTINKWDRILAAKEVILHAIQFELKEHGALQNWINNHLYIANPTLALQFDKIQPQHLNYYPDKPIVIHDEYLLLDRLMIHAKKNIPLISTEELALSVKKQGTDNAMLDIIEPDWLFRINNEYFFIEIDLMYRHHTRRTRKNEVNTQFTISEAIEKIIQQVPKGVPIKMLYVQVDDSFPFNRFYHDQIKRTTAIKTQIDSKLLEHPFLSLYVCTLNRSQTVMNIALDNIWDYQNDDFSSELFIALKQGMVAETNIAIFRDVEYLTSYHTEHTLFQHLNITDMFLVHEKELLTKRKKYFIPFVIREGDLTAQYQLLMLAKKLRQYKPILNETDCIKILAMYPNTEQFNYDIHRDDLVCEEIFFFSIEDIPISTILNAY